MTRRALFSLLAAAVVRPRILLSLLRPGHFCSWCGERLLLAEDIPDWPFCPNFDCGWWDVLPERWEDRRLLAREP